MNEYFGEGRGSVATWNQQALINTSQPRNNSRPGVSFADSAKRLLSLSSLRVLLNPPLLDYIQGSVKCAT